MSPKIPTALSAVAAALLTALLFTAVGTSIHGTQDRALVLAVRAHPLDRPAATAYHRGVRTRGVQGG
jgi:hypothetical protein